MATSKISENYLVVDTGEVFSIKSKKVLKGRPTPVGYLRVALYDKGTVKYKSIHRLVAEAFIPNPDNLPQVHHIDGDKTNNHVSNLMWVTAKENSADPIRNQRLSKKVRIWKGDFSKVYDSVRQASTELNIWRSNISAILNGRQKTIHGYHAEYYKEG